ncbi:hypothetical protein GQ43DRAFT_411133 [Delitschia confertaspora ATCC 74209]|uniref:Mso1 N-terminal domain-containing protein n=1 Tax=Delitschia confertaspora ATCC 74209 TaxID=1513339 RepID=A0A9P4N1C7_9PLEO|nr:hypothetical protein GQ43DRAFT_411133 [Delitschia confertaspora ATCC 74209]
MSSYISNLLTTTTSRYNSLRRNLLSDEADGDTEDDSHISRALRAYYTEKGRPFPPWLPPDPKAPQPPPTQFVSSSGRQPGQLGIGRGGGLSDLWDTPQQQPAQQEPSSLRRAQGRSGGRLLQPRQGMVDSYSPEPQLQGRPLPSQRAGSYQSTHSLGRPSAEPSPTPSAGSGGTAQERLKARLWGSGKSSNPSPPPGGNRTQSPGDRPSGSLGGGRPPYPDDRSSSYLAGGTGGRPDPNVYEPGGYGAGQGAQGGGRRFGLPSGPRMR